MNGLEEDVSKTSVFLSPAKESLYEFRLAPPDPSAEADSPEIVIKTVIFILKIV